MAENNFTKSIVGNQKEKTVKTEKLLIQGQLLKWDDVVIQISNISMITASDIQGPNFPLWSVFLCLVGIYLLNMKSLWYIGVALVIIAGIVIYTWYSQKKITQAHKYLNILMNSGYTYSILFESEPFLKKVLQIFANIFEAGSGAGVNYFIDLTGCRIDNNSSVIKTVM